MAKELIDLPEITKGEQTLIERRLQKFGIVRPPELVDFEAALTPWMKRESALQHVNVHNALLFLKLQKETMDVYFVVQHIKWSRVKDLLIKDMVERSQVTKCMKSLLGLRTFHKKSIHEALMPFSVSKSTIAKVQQVLSSYSKR